MSFSKEIKRILLEHPQMINDEGILEVFRFQYRSNNIYRTYCEAISRTPSTVKEIASIPFLPISFFKNHKITSVRTTTVAAAETVFYSSGTTSSNRSAHYVTDAEFYKERSRQIFESYYGILQDYIILAVLPSYEENPGSSLIFMLRHFIECTKHSASGFYSFDRQKIRQRITELSKENRKILVWGVSYALLDWAEEEQEGFPEVLFLETGGMKGRREELTRAELHARLQRGFKVASIHSEYGMTELLSQAYSKGEGDYRFPAGFIPRLRDITDPFGSVYAGSGGINVIDLANIDSCCFIETQDVGRISQGTFEITGRIDLSDARGCNLLYM